MVSPVQVPTLEFASLRTRLAKARAQTDFLFHQVLPSALYDRPIPERHRLIFYLGHLEAFDWNLMASGANAPSVHPEFNKLFAFGIDPVDSQLPSDQPEDWPSETQVRSYCTRVRSALDGILASGSTPANGSPELVDGTLLNVAIEHRLMHAETLAYLLHQLSFDKKIEGGEPHEVSAEAPSPRTVTIPMGDATLGMPRGRSFGWDNEFEECGVPVPEFRADAFPVTNAQFLEFLRAGGYNERSLWSDEDWKWKTESGTTHPAFWTERSGKWNLRAMFAEIPLPAAWPVYVSHAEASAFARWARKRLPTEAQWHRMAYGTSQGTELLYPWGGEPPSSRFGNFDFRRWDPSPVQAHPDGRSEFGVADLAGNGWEWTSTPFAPFPGFEPFSFYPGYSANFFDGQHYVMKGGSPRTAACMLRRTFRNWFQPHYPYIYAKFRCVEG